MPLVEEAFWGRKAAKDRRAACMQRQVGFTGSFPKAKVCRLLHQRKQLLIMDEWRTSKLCCACHQELVGMGSGGDGESTSVSLFANPYFLLFLLPDVLLYELLFSNPYVLLCVLPFLLLLLLSASLAKLLSAPQARAPEGTHPTQGLVSLLQRMTRRRRRGPTRCASAKTETVRALCGAATPTPPSISCGSLWRN